MIVTLSEDHFHVLEFLYADNQPMAPIDSARLERVMDELFELGLIGKVEGKPALTHDGLAVVEQRQRRRR